MWSLGFVMARLDLGHWFWGEMSLCGYKTKPRVVCKTSEEKKKRERGEIQEKFCELKKRNFSLASYWLVEGTFPKRICCGKIFFLAGPYSRKKPYCTAAVQAVRPLEGLHLLLLAVCWFVEAVCWFWACSSGRTTSWLHVFRGTIFQLVIFAVWHIFQCSHIQILGQSMCWVCK